MLASRRPAGPGRAARGGGHQIEPDRRGDRDGPGRRGPDHGAGSGRCGRATRSSARRAASPGTAGCAGSWTRWMARSTTCTGWPTGRSASPPRWTARCVAGVVAMPRHGELFTAIAGQGSWLHQADGPAVPLRCNTGVPLRRALVSTGFGYERARRMVQGEVVAAVLPQVRDIRRRRLVRGRFVLGGGRPGGRLLRARRELLGLRGGRPDRAEAGARVAGLAGRPAQPGAGHRRRARPVRASCTTCWPAWTQSATRRSQRR